MQLTWKSNYEAYGKSIGQNFLGENKHKIANDPVHAVGSAIWFWHNGKEIDLSNLAKENDFIAITRLIDGGYNGYDDREKYYKKAISALNMKQCKTIEKNIISKLVGYKEFENSYIYSKKIGECFGWGLWNDPKGGKKGIKHNLKEAKKGYQRFIELSQDKEFLFGYTVKNNIKISRKRYGHSAESAKSLASQRLNEL